MPKYCEVVFNLPVNQIYVYDCTAYPEVSFGKRVKAPLRKRLLTGFVIGLKDSLSQQEFSIKEITKVIDKEEVFDQKILRLAQWLAKMYLTSLGEALALIVPGAKREKEYEGSSGFHDSAEYSLLEFSREQQNVIQRLQSLNEPYFYLFGVTGSGKTLIYLEQAKYLFKAGKSVIYLVPEIALITQIISAIKTSFGDLFKQEELAMLHSGLTPAQRLKEWLRIKRGEARLVVGVRSAVFAPCQNLGLIIIDEEHENTYKSSSAPRYHARQVAMHRAKEEKALCLLGSATPSLEAFFLMQSGKLPYSRLNQRPGKAVMPVVEIVNLTAQENPLSPKLIKEIKQVKAEGGQCILFLNRRGFAHFYRCNSCSYEMKCKNCSVVLTYHKKRDLFICHYCGFKLKPPPACPNCSSLDTVCLGFGTERVEEELRRVFPDFTIARLDTDSAKKKQDLNTALNNFKSGQIDILLGTQMVAKGLNVRRLKLVGVIYADSTLLLPDFRAAERTFSLLVQVSGRAGRYEEQGKVLIQSFRSEHPAIKLAAQLQIDAFYQNELALREELGFPPYTRLIRLVLRGRNRIKVKQTSKLCTDILAKLLSAWPKSLNKNVEILGPAECPLALIACNYRYQLILRAKKLVLLQRLVAQLRETLKIPAGVYLEIDVDPLSLL